METKKLYKKALVSGFGKVSMMSDRVIVENNTATMRIEGFFGKDGEIEKVSVSPSILCMLLGLITLPLGTIAIAVYYLAKQGEREQKMKTMMAACQED